MLSKINIAEFQTLKQIASKSLRKRQLIPIVPENLYFCKDGSWHVRFQMSGYNLSKPNLPELLKAFAFASSGAEITNKQVEKNGPVILGKLIEAFRKASGDLSLNQKRSVVIPLKV